MKSSYLKQRLDLNEANDCAPIAIALSTGNDYKKVIDLLIDEGRKPRTGTYDYQTKNVMKKLGYDKVKTLYISKLYNIIRNTYPKNKNGYKQMTVRHHAVYKDTYFWKSLRYVSHMKNAAVHIKTRGHILTYKNGKILDWTKNTSCRIKSINIYVKNQ